MQRGSQSNDKQASANENSFYAHRRNKMEPAFDEENRGEEMETDRGVARAAKVKQVCRMPIMT